jgi:hypothetical protein
MYLYKLLSFMHHGDSISTAISQRERLWDFLRNLSDSIRSSSLEQIFLHGHFFECPKTLCTGILVCVPFTFDWCSSFQCMFQLCHCDVVLVLFCAGVTSFSVKECNALLLLSLPQKLPWKVPETNLMIFYPNLNL